MKITLYKKAGCPWSAAVIGFLNELNVPFEIRNVITHQWLPYAGLVYFHMLLDRLAAAGNPASMRAGEMRTTLSRQPLE